jgi:hypothetical protein
VSKSIPIGALIIGLGILLSACSGSGDNTPASPSQVPGAFETSMTQAARPSSVADDGREIRMQDQCDPESFNAVIGPGTCARNGGLKFDTFVALLQQQAQVPGWRFSPGSIHVPREMTLPIVNTGGETHTFTEVEEFGGGIVPQLNALAGTPVPAPECLALAAGDFIPAGGKTTHTFEPGESDKYQCCIHPWMHATAH